MTPPIPLLAAADEGFHVPGIEAFEWPAVVDISLFGVDLSINRTVLIMLAGTLLISALFTLAFRKPKIVPKGLQNVMEAAIGFIREQVVLPVLGQSGLKFLPYLASLFFFILMMNLFEVIPGVNFPPTSRIGIPLVLALTAYVLFIWVGVRSQGLGGYLKETLFPPGAPWPVYFLLTPVEFISNFIARPASLTIRLMANMIAGHLLLTVLFLGTAYLFSSGGVLAGFGVLTLVASVAAIGFEIMVGALQAFIFVMLTAVYISLSKEAAH
jgi:F-type H+-transporting ATPase subunit a